MVCCTFTVNVVFQGHFFSDEHDFETWHQSLKLITVVRSCSLLEDNYRVQPLITVCQRHSLSLER